MKQLQDAAAPPLCHDGRYLQTLSPIKPSLLDTAFAKCFVAATEM